MTDQPEKLDLASHDISEEKKQELLHLFPEIRTEGGIIDFDKLKLVLGETIDIGRERYGMNWPGKAECFKTIQAPSMGTLLPASEESVDFETTENLFIEGDNLEILKLLQKAYLGKIKMIYIDPPYNTGKDFIYPDNYTESLQTYLEFTGQVDAEGKKFGTNTEDNGRFHSRWLNMIYPRLYLARNLLQDDGVIFISIDENEFDNLKKVCDEIFGEENFIACVTNVNNPKGRSDDKYVATAHEYLMIYKKYETLLGGWKPEEKVTRRYRKSDANGISYREMDLRKTGDADKREDRPYMFYYFLYQEGTGELKVTKDEIKPKGWIQIKPIRDDGSDGRWRWGYETAVKQINNLVAKFMPVRKIWGIFEKDYLLDDEKIKPTSAWTMKEVNTERGTEQLIDLGFDKEVFPRPKPFGLLLRILELGTKSFEQDIVLDFFAGSGTLAHSVLALNKQDTGNRKFILVQLPEPCEENTEAAKAGFLTIADITKERVRRVIKKINDEEEGQLSLNGKQDRGFRVFKLAESNFKTWDATAPKDGKALEKQLELHIDHVREGRMSQDILYEILLKSGFPLTTPVEKIEVEGKSMYSVADGGMLICLDKELTLEAIRAMAEMKPQRVVCLDLGFAGNDQLKTNAVQIFKNKEIVFKTV